MFMVNGNARDGEITGMMVIYMVGEKRWKWCIEALGMVR